MNCTYACCVGSGLAEHGSILFVFLTTDDNTTALCCALYLQLYFPSASWDEKHGHGRVTVLSNLDGI